MIIDVGKKRIRDLMKDDFKYIGVGDGGDDSSTAQTTLDNEISETSPRKIATVAPQGNTLVYDITFSGSNLTGNIINELGIFNSAGTLLTRVNFKAIGPLGSSDSVAFTFRLVVE